MTVNDKAIERKRYDAFASQIDKNFEFDSLAEYLKDPYLFYMSCIELRAQADYKILELGSGTGNFTEVLLRTSAAVVASDISARSLEVLASLHNSENLTCLVMDMEELNKDEEFDIIVSAGSLSYGDNAIVLNNIYQALKPGGFFICVDSLNNNWIYRLNRFFHYLTGRRSLSTLRRMPSTRLFEIYNKKFEEVTVTYFGSLVWLAPVLKLFLRETPVSNTLKWFDTLINVKYSAFKFVMVARKNA